MELCQELLMLDDPFIGVRNDPGELAMKAYQEKKPILNGRFVYEDLRVRIPVLLQEDGKTILYVTYTSCFPKESEAQMIADMSSVLALLEITIDEIYAIHLNHAYVRGEDLLVRDLLVVSEYLYNAKNKAHKRIDDLVAQHKRDVLPFLDTLRTCEEQEDVPVIRSSVCTRGNKCIYFGTCFPEKLADTSILHLVQSSHKFEMEKEGITHLQDVDVERIEGTRHQYAQIMAAKQGGSYVDKVALRCWVKDHIQYPISYLDFEWETFAYPPYQGMKPFDVLTFQYSLHVEQEPGGPLTHTGYIGEGDCREAFLQDLLAHVPKQGVILVYNMEGAEKLRLRQLAEQFPSYASELQQLWERMVDLSLPFSTGNVYDSRMAGFYSLKTLVPIFSSYNYQDMEISYGLDAVEKWRKYGAAEGQEKAELYEQLSAYCSMDTYAEYIVFHALKALMTEE